MMTRLRRSKITLFLVLFVVMIIVLVKVAKAEKGSLLKVAYLDIGQGDSIYIEAPNGRQILIDGGRDRSVLEKLGEVMPYFDHSIDVVIGTHPDADHIGGLPFVLEQYSVGAILEPGVSSDTKTYQAFEDLIVQKNIPKVIARRGMSVVLDKEKNIYLDILFPNQDVSGWETNAASIVAKLTYGEKSFMFTGDSPIAIENYLVSLDQAGLKTNVLKLGHHGSRTSSSELYLRATAPEFAIISAGLHNSYGHPHKEVTDLLQKFSIPALATFAEGTISFTTDGTTLSHH